jgi:hypothetical protein
MLVLNLEKTYYEFPILKYNSLVTDYKLSSTISNAISTTVSIAAQNVGAGHAAYRRKLSI